MIDNIHIARINVTQACDTVLAIARKDNGIVFLSDVRDELCNVFCALAEAEEYLINYIEDSRE